MRSRLWTTGAFLTLAGTAVAAFVIADDLIVGGSACVGFDCVTDEVFDGDTVRLKENNLRIKFEDTSDPTSAPANDWRITANAAFNGGAGRFSIDDVDGDPFGRVVGTDVATDTNATTSVQLGDLDGDSRFDLVAGNLGQPNRLYLNNGTPTPFAGVTGTDVTPDGDATTSIALADVDGDMVLDLVAGNADQPSRLYLNNGTTAPFAGVIGTVISADADTTTGIALGTLRFGARPDLVVGNMGQPNRLYLNNGTADPFGGVTGADITADSDQTTSIVLGHLNGDPFLDLVVGNMGQPNRLYLNNGTADPFGGVTGSDITADSDPTTAVALGDVNGDMFVDLVAGNAGEPSRLYLNNGTADPFAGVTGADVGPSGPTSSLALDDVDGDGSLDLVVGSDGQPIRIYRNNGTADPFAGVVGIDLTPDTFMSTSLTIAVHQAGFGIGFVAPASHLVVGNLDQVNRIYPIGDRDGGAKPFAVEAAAPSDALFVARDGRVGLGTAAPDPSSALDVSGNVRVEGDLQIAPGVQGGVVPASAFAGGKTATVTFAEPYTQDYVIILTAIANKAKAKFAPTIVARDASGFTLTSGGKPKRLVEVHWATRLVGEY